MCHVHLVAPQEHLKAFSLSMWLRRLKYNINILILLPSVVTYVALRVYDLIFRTQKLEQVYHKVKEMLNKKIVFCAFVLFEILAWILHISLR